MRWFLLLPLLTLLPLLSHPAYAQSNTFDVVFTYKITDTEAINGDLLVSSEQGLKRATLPFEPKLFGVLQTDPVVVYRSLEEGEKPVSRSGVAIVNVTNLSGPIKSGDYITSSPVSGKGQKSSQSGYTLGIALEDFSGENGETIEYQGQQYKSGQIKTAVKIEYSEISTPRSVMRLFDLFNIALFQNLQDSTKSIEIVKYFAALIVLLASVSVGFFVFARSIPKSIEALGRNPLAHSAIQLSIVFSVLLTVLTALVGIAAAYIILRI